MSLVSEDYKHNNPNFDLHLKASGIPYRISVFFTFQLMTGLYSIIVERFQLKRDTFDKSSGNTFIGIRR